ncbi:NIL domain-containing protein [Desulfobacterota bacterium M19]
MYKKMYLLRFTKDNIDQPLICDLVKKYNLDFNILRADIFMQQDGVMILELSGPRKNVQAGLKYLKKYEVKVETMATVIKRDDEKCFQCGACTGRCSTGALSIKRPEMAVIFDPEKCTGCGLCVPVCPVQAMNISLDKSVRLDYQRVDCGEPAKEEATVTEIN